MHDSLFKIFNRLLCVDSMPHAHHRGFSRGTAVPLPSPPPIGGRPRPTRPPHPRGPAATPRRAAWAEWTPRRGPLAQPRNTRRPKPHTVATGHGLASRAPPRPHHHGTMRTRRPGPGGSALASAFRTSHMQVGASSPFDRSKPVRPSLITAAP